jgi:hypothetical protein
VNEGVAYMRRSIDAAFDLVARNPRAWSRFDLTVEGFFRSFAAIVIVIPLNILLDVILTQVAVVRAAEKGAEIVVPPYGLGEAVFSSVALCVQWMIFPLAMIPVLRYLGLAHRYTALIIAHNWGTVVVMLFNMPAFLLYAAGVIGAETAIDIYFIVLGLTLYYRFYVAQTALDAGWGTAAAIALLHIILQAYFQLGVSNFAGLWLPAGI